MSSKLCPRAATSTVIDSLEDINMTITSLNHTLTNDLVNLEEDLNSSQNNNQNTIENLKSQLQGNFKSLNESVGNVQKGLKISNYDNKMIIFFFQISKLKFNCQMGSFAQ